MDTIYRIMGKKGRTTIPFAIRMELGLKPNDVLSFKEGTDGQTVVVRREIICDGCSSGSHFKSDISVIKEMLSDMTDRQQRAALKFLSKKWRK